jgi:predicted acetyltransferase
MDFRLVGAADTDALVALRIPAFGPPGTLPTDQGEAPERWGAYVGDELVASITRLAVDCWLEGERVPTTAIASVAIAPEHRGRGVASALMRQVLEHGRTQGDRVAALFATDPGIYRRLGFEVVGRRRVIDIDASELAGFTRSHTLRRADEDDLDAIAAIYTAWARTRNGPFTREHLRRLGSWFTNYTGVTLALDAQGTPVGYAAWKRGPGYRPDTAWIRVYEMVGPDSARDSLLWMFSTFSTVVGTVRITAPLESLDLPGARPRDGWPFMVATLDPALALPTTNYDTLDDF